MVLDGDFVLDADGVSDYDWEYRFTSRERDAETGLHYFRARYYHDGLGRFLGRDPLNYIDGASLYAAYFVPGGVDPTGMEYPFCDPQLGNTYWKWLSHPWQMDWDIQFGFWGGLGTTVVAGGAAAGLGLASGGAVGAATTGIGTQATITGPLGAGTWPAIMVGGQVFVARFHVIAWEAAGRPDSVQKYGMVVIDCAGKVVGWK